MKICVICNEAIGKDANGWKGGHNAAPVAQGTCCGRCNSGVVMLRRLIDAGYTKKEAAILVTRLAFND